MIAPTYISGLEERLLRRLIKQYMRGRVLDVGCGDGSRADLLPAGTTYTGVDPHGAGKNIITGPAENIPLPDTSFDSALCASALEHVEDEGAVVREIYRLLKPGGTVLITLPFLVHYHQDPDDYRRLTHAGLTRLLEEAGFRDVKIFRNNGAFAVVEFTFFSALVHARREHYFSRYWYYAPYWILVGFFWMFFRLLNIVLGPLQSIDESLYVGLAAVAKKNG